MADRRLHADDRDPAAWLTPPASSLISPAPERLRAVRREEGAQRLDETRTPPSVPATTSFFSVSLPWADFVPETVRVPLNESGNPDPAASRRPLSSTPGAIAYRSNLSDSIPGVNLPASRPPTGPPEPKAVVSHIASASLIVLRASASVARGAAARAGTATGGYAPGGTTRKDGRWQVAGTVPSVIHERTARIAQNELSAPTTL